MSFGLATLVLTRVVAPGLETAADQARSRLDPGVEEAVREVVES